MLAPGAAGFAMLAVAWLAGMLWSGQRAISSANTDSIAIAMAAYSLPGVISASLVSGAAMGLTLTNLLTRRGVTRAVPRFATAVGAGLVTGVLAGLAVTFSYGHSSAMMVLAGAIAAAATIGGTAAGLRNAPAVGAVVTAGLAVFAVAFILATFKSPLLSLYGYGATEATKVNAVTWYSRTAWLAGGLAAGLVTFFYLRWAQRRANALGGENRTLRWPVYLIAGAGPGLLLLATEALTRTAGGQVLALAKALSVADGVSQGWLGSSRFTYALGVLFVGSFTALMALGRTLRPMEDPADDDQPVENPADDDPADEEPADEQTVVGAGRSAAPKSRAEGKLPVKAESSAED
jgi:hypothetical protein